jgi:hypothetical protein
MDHEQALRGYQSGDLTEAVVVPAADANGWMLTFTEHGGGRATYTGHTGTEKVYHSLDQVTEVALDLGFETVRVEEEF